MKPTHRSMLVAIAVVGAALTLIASQPAGGDTDPAKLQRSLRTEKTSPQVAERLTMNSRD
ncbi:MAG TPA: hypothetical protein VG944_06855 [Fimbriimonas sp.]|nr:hypothetical protein [Fimbriimonas sp.]